MLPTPITKRRIPCPVLLPSSVHRWLIVHISLGADEGQGVMQRAGDLKPFSEMDRMQSKHIPGTFAQCLKWTLEP